MPRRTHSKSNTESATTSRSFPLLKHIFLFGVTLARFASAEDSNFIQGVVTKFQESDFVFGTSISNTPYPPFANFAVSSYQDVAINGERGSPESLDILKVSQGAFFPVLLDSSNALLFGEYLTWSSFEGDGEFEASFDVSSLSIPAAWMRQNKSNSQQAAFLMPTAHHSSLESGTWSWQLQGGVFGRKIQNEQLWWAYGLFIDLNPNDNYALPYLGASWALSPEWTISAIMPWPAISYAPSDDLFFRLGASPSGASWNVDRSGGEVSLNLSTWDFGLAAEKRLKGSLWASLETGVSGLGTFLLNSDGDLESPQTDVSSSWYLRLALRLRPGKGPR